MTVSSEPNLVVTINDANSVSYDGLYEIVHEEGHVSETNNLLVCHVKEPPTKYANGGVEPFVITSASHGSDVIVEISPYTLTNEADCGNLVYTATVDSPYYDPFGAGHATWAGTTLTLSSVALYPIGLTYVRVDVSTDLTGTAAYSIQIPVTVCEPPAITTRNVVHANTETSSAFTYTNFVGAGLDASTCNLGGTVTWEVSGPAPAAASQPIADPPVSSWLSISGDDLVVTVSAPSSVDYDGLYQITHAEGHATEANELLICHVKQPATKYVSGAEPFLVAKQSAGNNQLTVDLTAYTLTADVDCGDLVYVARVAGGYDPFVGGHATLSGTTLTFSSIDGYPAGAIDVRVDVRTSLTSTAAYSIAVPITVIDCLLETMSTTDPGTCPIEVEFPTFSFQYQWNEFTFPAQPTCLVEQYKVSVTDPSGAKDVRYFAYDGTSSWQETAVTAESQAHAFGALFSYSVAGNGVVDI